MKSQGAVVKFGVTAGCAHPLAPFPMFPFALITIQLSIFDNGDDQKIAIEGKENGRAFLVALEWYEGRPNLAMRSERDENYATLSDEIGRAIFDQEIGAGKRKRNRRVVRSGNDLFFQGLAG